MALKENPLVSIIIPVYNVEPYLKECLDSVVNQSYKNLEIILVDDGSTDNSGIMCDDYASGDERIKVIHKKNEGLNYARKTGFENSTGEYISFLDSDDVIEKNFVKYLIQSIIGADAEIALCSYDNFALSPPMRNAELDFQIIDKEDVISAYLTSSPLLGRLFLQTAHMKIYARKLIELVNWNITNYKVSEDEAMSSFIYASLTKNNIPIIKNELYLYRQRSGSLTDSIKKSYNNSINGKTINRYEFLENIKKLRLKLFGEEYEDEIYSWFSMNFIIYLQSIYISKESRPSKKDLFFYNKDFEKIAKSHEKYPPWGIYKEIFNAIKESGNINTGFYGYMKENPLVSVIIPVYNVESYLKECLDSVVNQSYKNLEIILVDDGSNDGSGAICDDYASGDERIKVIHKKNGGVSEARNLGIKESRGEYITFVDADDFIDSKAMENLVTNSKKYKTDITIGDRIIRHTNGYTINHSAENIPRLKSFSINNTNEKMMFELLAHINSVWGKLYKKDFIIKNNIIFPTDIKIGEDFEFLAKAYLNAKNMVYIKDVVYYYRQDFSNDYSATGNVGLSKALDFGHALKNVNKYAKKINPGNNIFFNALKSASIPHSLYALLITEGDSTVHKKVYEYIRTDLFKYFGISKSNAMYKNQEKKVSYILKNDYNGLLLSEIADRKNVQNYLEYQLYHTNKELQLQKSLSENLEKRLNYATSKEGMIRIPLGKIKRKLKKLIS